MHRTRVLRIRRLGVRTVATAPKTLLNLNKWALPKATISDSAAPSTSHASTSIPEWLSPSANSARSGQRSRQAPPHAGGAVNGSHQYRHPAPPNAVDTYLGKWARPSAPSNKGARSSTGPSSSSTASTQKFVRDVAPHTSPASRVHQRQPDKSGSVASGSQHAIQKRTEERQREPEPRDVRQRKHSLQPDSAAQAAEYDEGRDTQRKDTRSGKSARSAFKERGSIAARLGSENVAIPNHSRIKTNAYAGKSKREKKFLGAPKKVTRDIFIPSVVSVGNLARLLNVRLERLQEKMAMAGMREQSSYDHMLNSDYASLVAMEFGRNPVINDEAAFDLYPPVPSTDSSTLTPRPPVVTIMGHVDHGKTTLLDTLRSTSVAKGEAGGITQHIGAFSVPVPASPDEPNVKRVITFLDTPGHAAFSAMRARGASVTDIVVLVVAADDGIMPQTREVLDLVKKETGKVGLVVAINKVDKPDADVSKVETALFAEGVQLESFGGDVPCVHVSGLTGAGLPQLVETISLVAEMQDLRAEKSGTVQGYVLESKVHKGLGNVATVLVLRGELKQGTALIAGAAHAKVRLLRDSSGTAMKTVLPGTAAVVSGWKELPRAGDEVLSGSESDVKRALTNRIRMAAEEALVEDVEAINQSRREERERREAEENKEAEGLPAAREEKDEKKELRIVLKGDVSGSVEAVEGALLGIGNNLAGVKIVASGVGDVSESDVLRAKAVDGVVVAFSVNVSRAMETIAVEQDVPVLKSSIIYELMDFVKQRVVGLLPVIIEKKVVGEANVLQIFDITIKGKQTMKVAGCRVINGTIEKNKMARVVRGKETVYEGKLQTLRHLKKDIMEASKGLECGMAFEGWDDLRDGDLVQTYQQIEKSGTL